MNRFIIKRLILMTMLTLFADQSLLYALDTTEVFSLGPVTDFEAYYGYDWDNDNKYPSGEFLIGGGITERFSYLIRGVLSQEIHEEGDTIRIFGGVGFGFIWTVKEKENMFAFDMLPAFTFVPNDIADNEKSAKPNFKGFSYGVSIEVNLTMISMLQPYLLAGYTNYNNTAETGDDEFDDDPYEAPLTFGTMILIRDGIELLAQLDWTLNEDTKEWKETNRSIAVGLNIMLGKTLEFISEYRKTLKIEDENGNEISPRGWGISIGFIFVPFG